MTHQPKVNGCLRYCLLSFFVIFKDEVDLMVNVGSIIITEHLIIKNS